MPPELGTLEWFGELRRVLAPGGLVLANVADEPGMAYAARVAAGAREAGIQGAGTRFRGNARPG